MCELDLSVLINLSSGMLRRIIFWLYTKVSEEYSVPIFRVEVRRFRKLMRRVWFGGGSGQEEGI
jgi:hypothetical protein